MRAYPDRKNTMMLLTEWARHNAAIEKMMDGIRENMGMDPNGVLFVTVWALFGSYTNTLAAEIGDFDGWLDWYHYDAEMGKGSMAAAGYDGKTKRIKTLANLFWLIEESRKRKPK